MTVSNEIIVHAEIPDLQIRKAVRVSKTMSVDDFYTLVKSKMSIESMEKYFMFRKKDQSYVRIESAADSTIEACNIQDKEIIYFMQNLNSSASVISRDMSPEKVTQKQEPVMSLVTNTGVQLRNSSIRKKRFNVTSLIGGGSSTNVASTFTTKEQSLQFLKTVFGAPLSKVMDGTLHQIAFNGLPMFLEKAIQRIQLKDMHTEGIFRLSGSAAIINQWKQRINNGEEIEFDNEIDIHAVAGLIKSFLRELPEPILTFQLFPILKQLISEDTVNKIRYLRACILMLPTENQVLLKRLLGFFSRLNTFEKENKMTLTNIATVIGPNLLKQKNETELDMIQNTSVGNSITMDLIRHYDEIYAEDSELIAVACTLYEFKGEGEDLRFGENEIVFIKKMEENGWWEGERSIDGTTGVFPYNYVQVLVSRSAPVKVEKPSVPETEPPTKQLVSAPVNVIKPSFVTKKEAIPDLLTVEIERRKDLEEILNTLVRDFSALAERTEALENENRSLQAQVEELKQKVDGNGNADVSNSFARLRSETVLNVRKPNAKRPSF